eukprot:4951049-Amphidinium_carterae.1
MCSQTNKNKHDSHNEQCEIIGHTWSYGLIPLIKCCANKLSSGRSLLSAVVWTSITDCPATSARTSGNMSLLNVIGKDHETASGASARPVLRILM